MTEQTFEYSYLYILFAKVGIIFFSLMAMLGLFVSIEAIITRDNFQIILFYVASIIIFFTGVWGSLKWLNKMNGHIIISSAGITEYCCNEGDTFIPWQKVKKIKYGRLFGGLVIVSEKKECVHIMNGIEQSDEIEKALYEYTEVYSKFREKNIVKKWLERIGIYI